METTNPVPDRDDPILDFANTIVVSNLQIITQDKLSKYKLLLQRSSAPYTIHSIHLPFDESGKSKGFAFLTYQDKKTAQGAFSVLNNKQVAKNTFSAFPLTEFLALRNLPAEYKPPEIHPYVPAPSLYSWMLDRKARSQYFFIHGSGLTAQAFDSINKAETILSLNQKNSTPASFWSKKGTYLAIMQTNRITLHGGPSFQVLLEIPQKNAVFQEWGGKEKYLYTYPSTPSQTAADLAVPVVWRLSPLEPLPFSIAVSQRNNPPQWSSDERYFALADGETLRMWDFPSFKEQTQNIPRLRQNISWSPTKALLALWTEGITTPSDIRLLDPRTMQYARTKSVLNATSILFSWAPTGDYLLALCNLSLKKGKETSAILIFRIKEKNIPVDTIELTETAYACNWDNSGRYFAFLVGDMMKPTPVIYNVNKAGKTEIELRLPPRACNALVWSPQGQLLAIGNLKSRTSVGSGGSTGSVEIFSLRKRVVFGSFNHQLANMLLWDPSGRYLAACVTQQMDSSGFTIYNAKGEPLYESPLLSEMISFSWRPLLPTLLSEEELKEFRSGDVLKEYARRFKKEDAKASETAEEQRLVMRRTKKADFVAWRKSKEVQDTLAAVAALNGPVDEYVEFREEVIEELAVEEEEPEKKEEQAEEEEGAEAEEGEGEKEVEEEEREQKEDAEEAAEEAVEAEVLRPMHASKSLGLVARLRERQRLLAESRLAAGGAAAPPEGDADTPAAEPSPSPPPQEGTDAAPAEGEPAPAPAPAVPKKKKEKKKKNLVEAPDDWVAPSLGSSAPE